jgi:CSLREA domain-containing protein
VTPAQAATLTVTSPADDLDGNPGDSICATAGGLCTLRAALAEANALPGADQLILPPNLYVLSLVDELLITDELTITGGGALTTIIDGNKSVRPNSRVLHIGSGISVDISGVTLHNGGTQDGGTEGGGGGVFNAGTLTLTNSTVSGNRATNHGGGINNAGTLMLDTSTVSGNTADIDAGGIYNASTGMLLLTKGTVSGNTAGDDGGGLRNAPGGALILDSSTVSGNHAGDESGGIRNGLATLILVNSTVSGNTANFVGGGITNIGTAQVLNSTITTNQADADGNGLGTGGGVYNEPPGVLNPSGGLFQFQNTILAGNVEALAFGDCAGTLTSNGNNVMQQVNCTVNGGGVTVAAPGLGPLQANGGPTLTHALLAGSPAIDGGNPGGCLDHLGAPLLQDQRGLLRPVDGNQDGTGQCDVGAVEFGN